MIARSAFLVAVSVALVNTAILLSIRHVWGYLYSSDEAVVLLVADILPLAAFFQLSDCIAGVGSGVLQGTGKQKMGAFINLSGYYILGLPLAALFSFKLDMGLYGLWAGIAIGVSFVALSQIYLINFRTDWDQEAHKALMLVSKHTNIEAVYDAIDEEIHALEQ